MLSLAQSLRQTEADSHGILPPYRSMADDKFVFRRGQLSMVAGAPGVAKSALAQDIALKVSARTLYLSADTDSFTMAKRTVAKQLAVPQYTAESMLQGNHADALTALMSTTLRYSFDITSVLDCADEVMAYLEVWGDYPELIIIDNLMNVHEGDDGDLAAMKSVLDKFHRLARNTDAHVMVLHHVSGGEGGANKTGMNPVPLSGVANQVTELPAQVLTLYRRGAELFICPVKQRDGRSDPSARFAYKLFCDLDKMLFSDEPLGAAIGYGGVLRE